jgi:hypothetical protein
MVKLWHSASVQISATINYTIGVRILFWYRQLGKSRCEISLLVANPAIC